MSDGQDDVPKFHAEHSSVWIEFAVGALSCAADASTGNASDVVAFTSTVADAMMDEWLKRFPDENYGVPGNTNPPPRGP